MRIEKPAIRLIGMVLGYCFCVGTLAHARSSNEKPDPHAIGPKGAPAFPLESPADLKFGDFFKTPVGAKGLEPTEKLLALNGRRVRIVGYLAQTDEPAAVLSYLTPYPIVLGHEDEPLADDLPASTVFIHSESPGKPIPQLGGLVRLTGRLAVGPSEESDGRVSAVRLSLDQESLDSLSSTGPARRKASEGPASLERP